jgi:SPP1 family predicted phage head-tail adaptor
MPAGKRDKRIEIHALTSIRDAVTGNVEPQWSLFAEAWANIRPAYMREFVAAGGEQTKASTTITIPTIAGIKNSMRVRHGERLLNIEGSYPDPDSGGADMVLNCSEVIDG